MNLEIRIERLEIQNITLVERMWELTGRLIKMEQVLQDHIATCTNNNKEYVERPQSSNPEELSLRLSAVASELNNVLPALANVILQTNYQNAGGYGSGFGSTVVNGTNLQFVENVPMPTYHKFNSAHVEQGRHEHGHFSRMENGINGSDQVGSVPISSVSHYDQQNNFNKLQTAGVGNGDHFIQNLKTLPFPSSTPEVGRRNVSKSSPKSITVPFSTTTKNQKKLKEEAEVKHSSTSVVIYPTTSHASENITYQSGTKAEESLMPLQHIADDLVHSLQASSNPATAQATSGSSVPQQKVSVEVPSVVYHPNPWGDELEEIPWEGDENIVDLSASVEIGNKGEEEQGKTVVQASALPVEIPGPSIVKNANYGLTRMSSSSSLISPATSAISIPVSVSSRSSDKPSASAVPKVEKLFNDYMKRHTMLKMDRKEWLLYKFANVTESQREEFLRAFSRHGVKQTTGICLAAVGHMVDCMIGANIVSQETVIKSFCEGIISDLPIIYNSKGTLFDKVMDALPFILVTIFNDTMKNLNWLVDLGKNISIQEPDVWHIFACEVIGIVLDRKKHAATLKLWNQTGSERSCLEQAAFEVKLIK